MRHYYLIRDIMSTIKHILTFTLRNELFAVDATAVKEIVRLSELTPAEEMPDYIVGVFNLRGHIVPVVDLNVRFGHTQERYSISDRVIILEVRSSEPGVRREENPPEPPFFKGRPSEIPPLAKGGEGGFVVGIIVNDVHDVVSVSENDIEPNITLRPLPVGEGIPHLISGEVKAGEEIIMLLDHGAIAESGTEKNELRRGVSPYAPTTAQLTPEELSIFHSRSLTLMQPPVDDVSGMLPFAVVSLGGECFGVDLDVVKEFADVREVTPVPCTPPHIVGDMNLRGEIMTLIDICGALNIAANMKGSRAVISLVNDLVAGVAVDDVIEVINISPNDVGPVPVTVKAAGNEYIKGEFPYQGKMLSILDMRRILTSKEIVVDEE